MATAERDRYPELTISFLRADTPDPACIEIADMFMPLSERSLHSPRIGRSWT